MNYCAELLKSLYDGILHQPGVSSICRVTFTLLTLTFDLEHRQLFVLAVSFTLWQIQFPNLASRYTSLRSYGMLSIVDLGDLDDLDL